MPLTLRLSLGSQSKVGFMGLCLLQPGLPNPCWPHLGVHRYYFDPPIRHRF